MSGNIRQAPATRLLLCISILIFSGCSQTVQPLGYGSVSCSYCKMQLEDRRFGGEIVTRYGRIYQFDDEPCLVHFMKSLSPQLKLKAKIYVADAAHNGKLIPAETATYFCTDQLVSPMNGNTMAFSNKAEMQIMIENLPGKVSQWSDILQKF
jgi:copper chaperone NosL